MLLFFRPITHSSRYTTGIPFVSPQYRQTQTLCFTSHFVLLKMMLRNQVVNRTIRSCGKAATREARLPDGSREPRTRDEQLARIQRLRAAAVAAEAREGQRPRCPPTGETIKRRPAPTAVCNSSGTVFQRDRARARIMATLPRRRNLSTSFSNGLWNPLMTQQSESRTFSAHS